MKKRFFVLSLLLFCAALALLDRRFLKANDGFCIRNIYGKVPADCPVYASAPPPEWQEICSHSFHYLDKGHQSYVFASDDGKYVLKFYRFPSHLRPFPWANHPFSAFSKKRQEIKEYNLQKLEESFTSFLLAFRELPSETGLLMLHLQPTSTLHKKIRLVDQLGASYSVNLDQVVFLLQKRAELIFPRLNELLQKQEQEKISAIISQIIQLIADRCKKGIVDRDAILEKNYGLLGMRAIEIDVGRFALDAKVKARAREEVEKITFPLKAWCQEKDKRLLQFYEEKLQEI